MINFGALEHLGQYLDMGFVKLWDPKIAQAVATEAQRFLSAARWN